MPPHYSETRVRHAKWFALIFGPTCLVAGVIGLARGADPMAAILGPIMLGGIFTFAGVRMAMGYPKSAESDDGTATPGTGHPV